MPEWDPEVRVDTERARDLIEAQFPELRGAPVRELATGWDNIVHLVDDRWVFRFPQREIAVAGVHREIATLGRLAPNLPLPIPEPRFIGAPTDDYAWPWFGAGHITGTEIAEAGVADVARGEAAAAVGRFLGALHGNELASRVASSLPVDPMRRADMAVRVPRTRQRIEDLVARGLWTPTAGVENLLVEASRVPPSSTTVVVHGDLHARHVLLHGGGAAAGVIDWGDVCAGDPSIDLSIAFGTFAGDARDALLDAYGPIDGRTELRARTVAVFFGAALLAYAAERGMDALRDESERSLERAVA
jgi:aminoglycoside phosphotransferase (APT) family kinase protein